MEDLNKLLNETYDWTWTFEHQVSIIIFGNGSIWYDQLLGYSFLCRFINLALIDSLHKILIKNRILVVDVPYSLLIYQTNSPEIIPSFFLLFINPTTLISISLKVFLYFEHFYVVYWLFFLDEVLGYEVFNGLSDEWIQIVDCFFFDFFDFKEILGESMLFNCVNIESSDVFYMINTNIKIAKFLDIASIFISQAFI